MARCHFPNCLIFYHILPLINAVETSRSARGVCAGCAARDRGTPGGRWFVSWRHKLPGITGNRLSTAGHRAWRAASVGARCLAPVVRSLVRMAHDTVAIRAGAAVLVGAAVAVALGAAVGSAYALAGWVAAVAVYVGWTWIVVSGMDSESTAAHATREDPTRVVTDLVVVLSSVASVGGVGYLLIAGSAKGGEAISAAGVGVVSVAAAWVAGVVSARGGDPGCDGQLDRWTGQQPLTLWRQFPAPCRRS